MTIETMTQITEQADPTEHAADNLRHLQHVFEGYRDMVLDSAAMCPHDGSTGGAMAWEIGRRMAISDLANR